MHPWHNIKIGEETRNVVTAVIEVPKSSKIKYEQGKEFWSPKDAIAII